jgi:ureidoglycolate lyase
MADARNIHHLRARPLTAEAFAPFGSLAALDTTGGRSVNQERGRRIPGLSNLAHDSAAIRPVLDVYHLKPSSLPFTLACFERHALTSQAFIPIRCVRLLIAVAPNDADGGPDVGRAMAFVSDVSTIIHYRAGVWHSPLVALDGPAVLSMLMWEAGDARDCEEVAPSDAIDIVL